MKITIDTKEDSHEEIKKVIKMLSSLVGEVHTNTPTNVFDDNSATESSGNVLADLFGNDNTPKDDDNDGYLNVLTDKKPEEEPKEDDTPQTIIEY